MVLPTELRNDVEVQEAKTMDRDTNSRLALVVTIASFLWVSTAGAQEKTTSTEKLGTVPFPVSCSAAAQPQFDRAVALLPSFWDSEGGKAFTAVAATDPPGAIAPR